MVINRRVLVSVITKATSQVKSHFYACANLTVFGQAGVNIMAKCQRSGKANAIYLSGGNVNRAQENTGKRRCSDHSDAGEAEQDEIKLGGT